MAIITPNWTDNIAVLVPTVLARGSSYRVTFDLHAKFEGNLYLYIGRTTTAAILPGGLKAKVRPTINSGAISVFAPVLAEAADAVAAVTTTVNVDSNSGAYILNVASVTGFSIGDHISIAAASDNVTRFEAATIIAVSGSTFILDHPLVNTHTAVQGDVVFNQLVNHQMSLKGGLVYEVIFNYASQTAGGPIVIAAYGQTYDSQTST